MSLENLNPKFWYLNEQGKITKYIYCRLCHAGPFKEIEKKIKFNFYGMGNKAPYCTACASTLKFFQSDIPPKSLPKPEESPGGPPENLLADAKEEPQELDISELD
jgi:hypothetical protein